MAAHNSLPLLKNPSPITSNMSTPSSGRTAWDIPSLVLVRLSVLCSSVPTPTLCHTTSTAFTNLGVMPVTGEIKFNPGTQTNPDAGYRSRFSHDTEIAVPGYYEVFLQDYGIKAQLTGLLAGLWHQSATDCYGTRWYPLLYLSRRPRREHHP